MAAHPHPPGGLAHERRHTAEHRRLPGTVGAEEGDDLALVDAQRHVPEDLEVAVGDAEPFDRQHRRPRERPARPVAEPRSAPRDPRAPEPAGRPAGRRGGRLRIGGAEVGVDQPAVSHDVRRRPVRELPAEVQGDDP